MEQAAELAGRQGLVRNTAWKQPTLGKWHIRIIACGPLFPPLP
jgi:hypothetical protein